jgi:hypothetical protein
MTKKKTKDKGAGIKALEEKTLFKELTDHMADSERQFTNVRDKLEEKEALLLGTLKDDYSTNESKSQVFDPRLSTIAFERSARVMSKLPMGRAEGVSKNDAGKNAVMNLTVDKYVVPNANSQWDFLIKSRLWDLYSLVYGTMFALVDWRVDDRKKYYGPDWWLLPLRDSFPQSGKISVNDCEHFQISTLVTQNWLEQRGKEWKHIDEMIKRLKDKGGKSRTDMDDSRRSHVEKMRHPDIPANMMEIVTEYRIYDGSKDRGEWINYSPDLKDKILRKIDNPHDNGEIPIVEKPCFPLLDSIYALGEFERGKTLQYAINSLINLYLDGVKMSIFPPILINPDGIVKSTAKMQPAARWLTTIPDITQVAKQLNINPLGLQTFNSTYGFLIAALLNQGGTTTTTITEKTDPGLGKTPQALKMLEARENSRDSWDAFMMEKAQSQLIKKMINLVAKKQTKPMRLRLFEAEMTELMEVYPDVKEMIDEKSKDVKVKSKTFDGIHFDYKVIPGSMKSDSETEQFQNLLNMMGVVLQNPQLIQSLNEKDKDIDLAEMFTRIVANSKIRDWDKIIVDLSPAKKQQMMLAKTQPPHFQDEETANAAQQIQQMFGGVGTVPPQPENANVKNTSINT